MKVDILTLFPENMNAFLHESIIGRAAAKGILDINCVQIRDYTENKQRQVDDYPYGGGWGCVMMAQPLKSCLDDVLSKAEGRKSRVIYMSPQGRTFDQQRAKELVRDYDHLVLVCGHYEGVDERFIEKCVDEEISIGNFVLTGGELAAMVVTDCVCRMVPGVLSDEECFTGESHWDGLLEYPQYTRPEVWEGMEVPEVLRGGNHADIERWRRKQMILRTRNKRPDMFEKLSLSESDEKLLSEIKRDESRMKLTQPIACRKAVAEDMDNILLTVRQGKNYLKKHRVDQWQSDYPTEELFEKDIQRGEGYVITYGGRFAGYFAFSTRPEPDYDDLTDGKWRSEEPYCVLHRAAVMAEYRGSGLSHHLMSFVEELARTAGRSYIRIDTHKKNKAMTALLREHGYEYRGNILVFCEPYHDPRRQAFDKIL
ncbi:MAG: tRNA (guanosine(37)-N1)-methyltransferase TrmD [Ruminococcaceae bacterium]|nr:tRNA (guanosine(37)-N1)-methyltransferase TrmD [Oscillospiraceae bacterium]